ncbi:MAG TPA: zinc-ribbon domain-containing protein [Gemmatimonas sp.]|uniref:zinc ribbon domain-containing protein n=1 Tax=Gemmatimonas sp. TaxID=1962908 RepID=UPI002ED9C85F
MTASKTPANSGGFCAACGAALSAGAKFCHRCGTPAGEGAGPTRPGNAASGGAAPGSAASVLPWGVAFVALLALVAMFAGRNFGAAKGSGIDGSSNSLPTQAVDGPAMGGAGAGPAPNIGDLSPSERANRLYQRMMTYVQDGKVDSVAFFAPMAMASHEMLESPTADERYHHGRIAEVTGNAAVTRAQADTILKASPDDLLGLLLAARGARMDNDTKAAAGFDKRLLDALQVQLASERPDYQMHRGEIDRAVEEARRK